MCKITIGKNAYRKCRWIGDIEKDTSRNEAIAAMESPTPQSFCKVGQYRMIC